MKTKTILFYFLIAAFALSCKKDAPGTDTIQGTLTLNVGLFLSINEEENNLKSTLGAEDFRVTIFNSQGIEISVFQRASDIPPEVSLDPGQYYVTAHSNNNLPAAFENPYYFGESAVFTIIAGGQVSITVNCEMANSRVAIVYSDQVKSTFSDYSATVSTSAGSLIFTGNESRAGYFQPLPISISVVLTWEKPDGTSGTKTLTGNIPNPQPRKSYEIHVNASINGSGAILINLDESVDPVEIVNITDNDNPVSGIIHTGDLLITEIMYDPVSLVDSEGEWFEIYNNTDKTVDLYQLVIRKNDTESHVIDESIQLPSHEYYVLSRTSNAVQGSKYIYGTSISLNNTGAVLSLCNYGTDGTNGSVIFSLNYGSEGFPEGTGVSIILSPVLLDYTNSVKGDSWCISTSAYITGDLGTPGVQNDVCL